MELLAIPGWSCQLLYLAVLYGCCEELVYEQVVQCRVLVEGCLDVTQESRPAVQLFLRNKPTRLY